MAENLETIQLCCPDCGEVFVDARLVEAHPEASRSDSDYLHDATHLQCPHCACEVDQASMVQRADGLWVVDEEPTDRH